MTPPPASPTLSHSPKKPERYFRPHSHCETDPQDWELAQSSIRADTHQLGIKTERLRVGGQARYSQLITGSYFYAVYLPNLWSTEFLSFQCLVKSDQYLSIDLHKPVWFSHGACRNNSSIYLQTSFPQYKRRG